MPTSRFLNDEVCVCAWTWSVVILMRSSMYMRSRPLAKSATVRCYKTARIGCDLPVSLVSTKGEGRGKAGVLGGHGMACR